MNKLKELRKAKGLTLREMEKQSGFFKTTISRYESGREPQVGTALKLAKFFGVTVEDIWGKKS